MSLTGGGSIDLTLTRTRCWKSGRAVYVVLAGVIGGLGASPSLAGADQFGPAPNSPVLSGSQPVALVSGDFNRDGLADLAVANQNAGTVTALLGNGSGQFSLASGSPLAVGPNPTGLAVGDFNSDGVPDLAVADRIENTVRLMLGGGDGTFSLAAGSPVPVGAMPVSLAVGDFTGAGVPDLAVPNLQGNSVSVLLGNGIGGLTGATAGAIAVGNPAAVAVGDFNSDGFLDMAVLDQADNTVRVFLGDGTARFTPAPGGPITVGTTPAAVAVADFNRDGKPDLAVANKSDGSLTLLLGNGDGSFRTAPGSPNQLGGNPVALAVADFNGDGFPDLAVADSFTNAVTTLLGDGAGGLAPAGAPQGVGSAPDALTTADFNGDLRSDLAAANFGDGSVSVLLNTAGGGPSLCDSCQPPVLGQSVNLTPMQGQVLVQLPARNRSKGLPFVPLRAPRQLPVNTVVDTTRGAVRLASAAAAGASVATQAGDFGGGVFQVLQRRQQRGLTELHLMRMAADAGACAAHKASISRRLSHRVVSLLRARASGRFRSTGRYSAATVRGTAWDTVDRCDGTLTRVHRGVVVVRDFRLQRNIVVRAGKSYLARAR